MFHRTTVFTALTLLITPLAAADTTTHDPETLFAAALADADRASLYSFTYDIADVTPSGNVVANFDPRRPAASQWQLKSPASAVALKGAQKLAWSQMTGEEKPDQVLVLTQAIGTLNTPTLISQDATTAEFQAKLDALPTFGPKRTIMTAYLVSTVTVQKSPPRILSITSKNASPFSFGFMLGVNSAEETVIMQYLPEIDASVIKNLSLSLQGSVLINTLVPDEQMTSANVSVASTP